MTTFKEAEHTGWTERAPHYDAHFAPLTSQAIAPLLSVVGNLDGKSVLDLCCGTGALSAAATSQGAVVTGVDFAQTMVDVASDQVPGADVQQGDAENLSHCDDTFDAVLCSFGLLHLADADKAIGEVARVLKPSGRFAYTTWMPPEKGADLFKILGRAIKAHGEKVELPPAPPVFRFADRDEAQTALSAQGFTNIRFEEHQALWTGQSGRQVVDLIYKGIVRTPMLIEAMSPNARDAVNQSIAEQAEAMANDGLIEMRWPYALVTAALR